MPNEILYLGREKLPMLMLSIGFVLMIVGLSYLILWQWLALLIVPGLLISLIYFKRELDLKTSLIRETLMIAKIPIRVNEKPISRPDYVLLRKVTISQRQSVLTISYTDRSELYRVNFVYPGNKVQIIFTGSLDKAKHIAKQCSEQWNLSLKDRTAN